MADSAESEANANKIRHAIDVTLNSGSIAALITVVKSDQLTVGAKLLVSERSEAVGDFGDSGLARMLSDATPDFLRSHAAARMSTLDELTSESSEFGGSVFLFERIETEPRLVIAGAGHVGASLARLGALVGYRVALIDDRAEFVARELFNSAPEQNIDLIAADDWAGAVRAASGSGCGVSIAIVTRGHKQDEDCLRAALQTNPDYVGMIGSKRRTNIVLEKLRAEGFAAEQLQKVRAPIGLDIGAVSPEEVALAILAEIVAERRGRSGGPLSSWRRA
ncbi:MAG TPA: XdhC family protein [Pyrinomonadaceae bacterium]|jgi:xanthine dehydrogenase accessory factor|nr:XdhC family protein [Pyrinomonadaceae bacterium]